MSDLRLCVICDALIDVEAEGMKVLTRRGGMGRRITVQGRDGRVHVVTTPRVTKKRLDKAKAVLAAGEKENGNSTSVQVVR